MEPLDKFGNPIYPTAFNILLGIGNRLRKLGYKESANKHNLFYNKSRDGNLFFADMRGTEEVPVWESLSPLFYWKAVSSKEKWLVRRIIKQEFNRLKDANCNPRLSFYQKHEPDELFFHGFDESGDGYCRICKKDFQNDGLYCSPLCETEANNREKAEWYKYLLEESKKIVCAICNRNPKIKDHENWYHLEGFIQHHTSYSPEIKIAVCTSCHVKIHKNGEAPRRPKRPWGKKGQLELKLKTKSDTDKQYEALLNEVEERYESLLEKFQTKKNE